jgi:hypothetical protein
LPTFPTDATIPSTNSSSNNIPKQWISSIEFCSEKPWHSYRHSKENNQVSSGFFILTPNMSMMLDIGMRL